MKKVIWLTGIFVIVFMLITGCYLLFFRDKSSKMPEGTFVRVELPKKVCGKNGGYPSCKGMEGTWNAWQRST